MMSNVYGKMEQHKQLEICQSNEEGLRLYVLVSPSPDNNLENL